MSAPTTIYVWFADEENGVRRIRKWDTEPFPEGTAFAAAPRSERTEWKPLETMPQVTEPREVLTRYSWHGRDGVERHRHEVLVLWPDGKLADHDETLIDDERRSSYRLDGDSMSYDKKCGELARQFLADVPATKLPDASRADATVRLAQAIQDAIEDFLHVEGLS